MRFAQLHNLFVQGGSCDSITPAGNNSSAPNQSLGRLWSRSPHPLPPHSLPPDAGSTGLPFFCVQPLLRSAPAPLEPPPLALNARFPLQRPQAPRLIDFHRFKLALPPVVSLHSNVVPGTGRHYRGPSPHFLQHRYFFLVTESTLLRGFLLLLFLSAKLPLSHVHFSGVRLPGP